MRFCLPLVLSGCLWATWDPWHAEYDDFDGDGHDSLTVGGSDCNDLDRAINPDAHERCDGVDNDCDGEVDESADNAPLWYADVDNDGHGDGQSTVSSCTRPVGYTFDNNCDGSIDHIDLTHGEGRYYGEGSEYYAGYAGERGFVRCRRHVHRRSGR